MPHCEIIETMGSQQYPCGREAALLCSDCGTAVCPTHSSVCHFCKSLFCSGYLDFHSHPKVVSVGSKRDRRKIA
jgi:hypothetical protein